MANEIKLKIKVDDNGNLKVVAKNADKAAKSIDKAATSTSRLAAESRTGYRALQGSAQATSNSTKAFSKQAGVVGGLVPIYATFAANVFAITAAFGVLSRAAALEKLEESLEQIGALGGRNLAAVSKELQALSGFAVSSEQALRAVSVGISAGFGEDQVKGLTRVAKGASLALGRDMGDAIDRLIRGTAKLEPEILDELGIIVRLDQAAEDYAISLGKTARQLTQFERTQAFVNATIEQGTSKYGKIAESIDADPYEKLAASFKDLTQEIIKFANAVIGPIVDFFAANSFALTGALVFFAGTLTNQVVPAIDGVIEKNLLISKSASEGSKKARQAIEGEYEKAAKKIKTLKFSPQVARELTPAIKAGTASTEELKRAIKSLAASERARAAQNKKYSGEALANYQRETQAIKNQRVEFEALLTKEKGRAGLTRGGLDLAGASRGSKRIAVYSQAIDNAGGSLKGFITSLGIASRGTVANAKEIGKAGTVMGAFTAATKAGATAVTLFGRAFLNAIPIIGQALFVLSLLIPVIQKIFGKSEAQKVVDQQIDKFKIFAKTINLVKTEISEAGSAFEEFVTKSRATSGVFDTLKGALITSGEAFDTEVIAKIGEAQEKIRDIRRDQKLGTASFTSDKQIERLEKQIENYSKSLGSIEGETVQRTVAAAKAQFAGAEKLFPEILKSLTDLEEKAKTGPVSIAEVTKALNAAQGPAKNLEGNLKGVGDQFAAFSKERNKLSQKQTTEFSTLIDQGNELGKTLKSISNADPLIATTSIKDFESEFAGATDLLEFLEKKLGIDIPDNVLYLVGAQKLYTEKLEKSNAVLLTRQGIVKEEQALLKTIQKQEKNSVVITGFRLEQEDNIIDAKIRGIRAQQDLNTLAKDEKAATAANLRLDAEIAALERSRRTETGKRIETLQAEANFTKEILGYQQKLLDAQKEQANLALRSKAVEDKGTLLNERQSNPFAFLTEEKRALDLEIKRTEELLEARKAAQEAEVNIKTALIEAEYMLLAQTLRVRAQENRILASRAAGQGRLDVAAKLDTDAGNLDTAAGRVEGAGTLAVENAAAAANLEIDNLEAKLGKLKESRANLEDINILINGAARSLESNMTNAFTALITGAKSAKQAFADMAVSILSDIAAMIAKQLVLNLLISSTGGTGGFFSNLFAGSARDGGLFEAAPSKRMGGVTEKTPGYATGGIARGRDAGYPAILHGTEAVVPLPNGKEIPVQMKNGGGQNNNVVVNVNVDSNGNSQQNSQGDQGGLNLGTAIATAVQKELQNQKRSGGILNPYGAA